MDGHSRLFPSLVVSSVAVSAIFGRFFQLIGMVILPIGLYIGVVRNDVPTEVRMLFIGGGFFLVGWLMARKSS